MSRIKGGYKIVSLNGLDLAGENLSLKGLYSALKNSYGKVIMLAGIIIDGVKKKDAYVQADEDNGNIVIKHVYGYNLSVDDEDVITVTEDSEGIELPVPVPADDGKIVGVNVQGKYVLKPSVKEQVESDAEEGTIVNALGLNADGELVKGSISGGTKLYKHTISIFESGGPSAVVTTNPKPITTYSQLVDIANAGTTDVGDGEYIECLNFRVGNMGGSHKIHRATSGQGNANFYYWNTSGVETAITFALTTEFTDTVTEL